LSRFRFGALNTGRRGRLLPISEKNLTGGFRPDSLALERKGVGEIERGASVFPSAS